jgi:hypothetical protein
LPVGGRTPFELESLPSLLDLFFKLLFSDSPDLLTSAVCEIRSLPWNQLHSSDRKQANGKRERLLAGYLYWNTDQRQGVCTFCDPCPTIPACSAIRLGFCFVSGPAQRGRALHYPDWAISELELGRAKHLGANSRMGSPALPTVPNFRLWVVEGKNLGTMA